METTPIVVSLIINLTLTSGKPPLLWKELLLDQYQKFPILRNYQTLMFHPISITPLLSRTVEHYIAKKFILPCLPAMFQFAYRPTCSTTACLVA